MSPVKMCGEPCRPPCPNYAIKGGRCREHTRQRERTTHPNRRIYNSKRWKVLARRVLLEEPLCPCGALAEVADHIVAIEDGGAIWSRANLQGLCNVCHSQKTSAELRAR